MPQADENASGSATQRARARPSCAGPWETVGGVLRAGADRPEPLLVVGTAVGATIGTAICATVVLTRNTAGSAVGRPMGATIGATVRAAVCATVVLTRDTGGSAVGRDAGERVEARCRLDRSHLRPDDVRRPGCVLRRLGRCGYYKEHDDKLNSFQLLLVERGSAGAFDIVFNYDQLHWESGDASDGVHGPGAHRLPGATPTVTVRARSSAPGRSRTARCWTADPRR